MWNYDFVLPSALVLLIFLIYYFSRPLLPIRMNRTFLWILVADILTIVTDFLSSYMDEHYTEYAIADIRSMNMAFFICFLARIYFFYLFTVDAMKLYRKMKRLERIGATSVAIVSIAVTISSLFSRAVFWIDEAGYHRGPLYNILYVCFFFYIGLSFLLILIRRKNIPSSDCIALAGYQMVLFVGNIVRIMIPQYLVMNTFCLLAIVIIYLSFENPDLYLSERGYAFNLKALRDVLNEYSGKQLFRILGVVLCNYNDERTMYGGAQMDQGIGLISRYIKEKYPKRIVFYIRSGCFIILGNSEMNCLSMRRDLIARFQKPWEADETDLYLTPSFIQTQLSDCKVPEDRLVNALVTSLDDAGKNMLIQTPEDELPSIQQVYEQMEVKIVLEQALEQNRVEIFLQPLYDCGSQRIVAAEVLARIRDADGRLIPPGCFIPVAEKNGHINEMGEQVFRKACAFIRDHDMEALGLAWLNVNLSPIQCMRSDLSRRFTEIVNEYGIPVKYIHLEITEQSMVDYAVSRKQIMELKAAGFQFALDDYGSGYSNLTRVKEYPFSNIKLDMQVVWDYFKERDFLIPHLIVAFRQMNFTITAEGIETEDMARLMKETGCDYLQGYYFSKPLPVDEFTVFCRKQA
ncbi:MAG: EAL domain-containing protein [Clostridia bacterium]|nr:EAL domain-containing protein [Clostridia bacterium]